MLRICEKRVKFRQLQQILLNFGSFFGAICNEGLFLGQIRPILGPVADYKKVTDADAPICTEESARASKILISRPRFFVEFALETIESYPCTAR